MTIKSKGLIHLTTKEERAEIEATGIRVERPVKLRYLRKSAQMGLRLWDVLSPQVDGYKYNKDAGFPTFSLGTLKEKGLVPK